jgi:chlorobactene glucosyltransferase
MTVLAAIIFGFWLLVLGHAILNLRTERWLSPDAVPAVTPLVSIVIPARNEAAMIETTVRAFLAQDYPTLEVIVVDDRSTDGTGDLVRRIGDPRVTVIDGAEPPAGWLGKPWALDQGSRRARGELILLVDADIIYAPPTIGAAVAEMQASGASMITFLPRIEMHGFGENVAMPMLGFVVFAAMPLWLSKLSRSPLLAVGGGAGNLVRRSDLEELDYFLSLKNEIVDDIGLGRRVREHGGMTRGVRADHLISVRMYRGAREIAEGFTKNMFAVMRRSYAASAVLLLLMAIFHLLPYALALTGNLLGIAAVLLISTVRVVIFHSLGYRLDNAIFLHPLMVLFWAYIVLRSVWITGIRRQVIWRGRTYDAAQMNR